MRFRKKPVEVDAIQWNGENRDDAHNFITGFSSNIGADGILIGTLEGDHRADIGDWIIKGVAGEFYPCKPDIFDLTYDRVSTICDMCNKNPAGMGLFKSTGGLFLSAEIKNDMYLCKPCHDNLLIASKVDQL